jgi:ABC-type uncharacterized transport system fused permease/ATPase subunit
MSIENYIDRNAMVKEKSIALSSFLSIPDLSPQSQNILRETTSHISNQINAQLGPTWRALTVTPHYDMAQSLGLLNKNISMGQGMSVITALNLIGYDLGNNTDLYAVLPDIDQTLERVNFFPEAILPVSLANEKRYPISQSFVHTVLKNGVSLKSIHTPRHEHELPTLSNELTRFINNLNLDDL